MIRFNFKPEKFVNAVAYFASKRKHLTKMVICKLVFFSDKEHLLRYGRPITGDTYYKLPHGPVPTRGLDILRGTSGLRNRTLAEQYIAVKGLEVTAKREPDTDVFSKSDLRIMQDVLEKYGDYSASYLRKLSHREPSWIKADDKGPMDFALFFENHPEAGNVLMLLESGDQDASRELARFRATV
jgi:uncharacterized phage-associated protein